MSLYRRYSDEDENTKPDNTIVAVSLKIGERAATENIVMTNEPGASPTGAGSRRKKRRSRVRKIKQVGTTCHGQRGLENCIVCKAARYHRLFGVNPSDDVGFVFFLQATRTARHYPTSCTYSSHFGDATICSLNDLWRRHSSVVSFRR